MKNGSLDHATFGVGQHRLQRIKISFEKSVDTFEESPTPLTPQPAHGNHHGLQFRLRHPAPGLHADPNTYAEGLGLGRLH